MNYKQVSRYSLSPDIVDGIVFWTKNPAPFLNKLDALDDYQYYFQFSLTSYGKDIEENLPDKHKLIETFKQLSERIGPERIIWRFDPILINDKYTLEYQVHAFEQIASELKGYTEKTIISFIDDYNLSGNSVYSLLKVSPFTPEIQNNVAGKIAEIAKACDMTVATCAEVVDLEKYGIEHARCVDSRIFENLSGHRLSRLKTKYDELAKDKAQRNECLCISSIDIGWPNTCVNGCRYCYATWSDAELKNNLRRCDSNSTMLCGEVGPDDSVTDHRGTGDDRDRSYKYVEQNADNAQLSLDV
jgi:DNA repair photolyase